jgi:hypothetical protein
MTRDEAWWLYHYGVRNAAEWLARLEAIRAEHEAS